MKETPTARQDAEGYAAWLRHPSKHYQDERNAGVAPLIADVLEKQAGEIERLREAIYYAKGRLDAYVETLGESRTGLGILVARDFLKKAAVPPASIVWNVHRDHSVESPSTDTTYWVNGNYPQTEIERLLDGANSGTVVLRLICAGKGR